MQNCLNTRAGSAGGSVLTDPVTLAGAVLGLLFLMLLGYTQRDRFLAGRNDFVQLYAGSQLSGSPRLYEPAASKEIHARVLGVWLESVYYSRPPFYAFLLRPLGMLPYKTAYWIFQFLNLLAFVAFLKIWAPRCRELPVFASVCLPLLVTILTGQDVGLALLAAAVAIEALRRKRDFTAGLLFAFCAIKIHLFVLVPVVLLIHRRWRVVNGGLAGGIALLGLSFLSDGLDWPSRYLALLSNPELHPGAEHMPTFRGLVNAFSVYDFPWVIMALSVVVLLSVVYIARRNNLEFSLAFALVGSLLVAYHAYLQDCAILLLVFVLVMEHSRFAALREATAIAVTPPLFFFLLSGKPWNAVVPLALLGLLSIAVIHSAAVLTDVKRGAVACIPQPFC